MVDLVFLYVAINAVCSSFSGPNVCFDNVLSKQFCCSDYEEDNGKCIECQIGFTSIKGQKCQKCIDNHYGKGCTIKCVCSISQRCHHVHGCFSSNDGHSSNETSTDFNYRRVNESDSKFEVFEISKVDLIIYFASTTGIIIILGICLLCCFFKRRNIQRIHKSHAEYKTEEGTQSYKPFEHIYHTIDESLMDDQITLQSSTRYRENKDSDNSQIGETEIDRASYLHPYTSLMKTQKETLCVDVILKSSLTKDLLPRSNMSQKYHEYNCLVKADVHQVGLKSIKVEDKLKESTEFND